MGIPSPQHRHNRGGSKTHTQDVDNCWYTKLKTQLKSDQELAIVALHAAMVEMRNNVIPINPPAGESESNGRVENAIRRTQEKFGTSRHHLEIGMKCKIPGTSPTMAWLIR